MLQRSHVPAVEHSLQFPAHAMHFFSVGSYEKLEAHCRQEVPSTQVLQEGMQEEHANSGVASR